MSTLRSHLVVGVWVVVLVGASVIVPLGWSGVAEGQEMVTLEITVEDRYGDSVGDVELQASWDGGNTTERTRTNGQALMDVPAGANVSIQVVPGDYVRNTPFNITDASGGPVSINVAQRGSVDLLVIRDGTLIQNAQVTFSQDGLTVASGVTKSDGQFETGPIERGRYHLQVTKPGHLSYETNRQLRGEVSWQVSLEQASVPVTFNVIDDHFTPNKSLANATVAVEGIGSVSTLGNGEATVRLPVNTEQNVTISKDGYEAFQTTLQVNESAMELNYSIMRTPELTIEPANDRVVVGETVRVTVFDEYDDPVANATIQIDGEAVGQTGDDGTATVRIESAGDRTITATLSGIQADVTVEGVQPSDDTTTETTDPDTTTETTEPDTTTETTDQETTESPTTTTTTSGPGFTGLLAIVALLSIAALARRR